MSECQYRAFTPDLEVRSGGDGRTVVGIAVPYGVEQRINDRLTERFERGAFNHQLRAARQRIPFMRGHKTQGGELIGRAVEMRDDAAGLYGEWRVSKTQLGNDTIELIRDGALDQLSIGFYETANGNEWNGPTSVTRKRADLTEVAVVPQGAYGANATISGVRAVDEWAEDDLPRLRAAEQILAALPLLTLAPGGVEHTRSESNLDNTPNGRKLWDYYLHDPKGSAWAASPHPWTALRDHLLKNAKGDLSPRQAEGLASNIFHAKFGIWPGEREGANPLGRG